MTLSLTISTPMAVLVDGIEVEAVRAEDLSGSFGILPGHTDLLTVLPASVVRWRLADGAMRYCAIRGAVFTVNNGREVAVACREGVLGDDLERLEATVHAEREEEADVDRRARVEQMRLHAQAVRQLMRFLRPQGRSAMARQAQPEEAP
ncbi:F0F1 ATP synthase subunit epsilon [Rhodobium gokarnense]|uniref:ATP synthase epsilon chain n=1 Tax=Rhodobium gokarnense TaxID=364296 RepID=A0ABT3H692_9HYPH|nr:F0F1 ATP synthase subunit epsilon [Rhodobium gokarnense]MCW2305907.1 F-type H+-transporting ATPase subunit epsilon [Rhodobium gokarnense]